MTQTDFWFLNDNPLKRVLHDIICERSFRTGEFTLASGQKSNVYFNLKPTLLHEEGAALIGDFMANMASEIVWQRYQESDDNQVNSEGYLAQLPIHVSGLAVGAVPLIAAMAASNEAEIRGTFVRKQVKDHGTKEAIEGLAPEESLAGKNVIVVEDVCTTGKSLLEAVAVLRAAGAIVTDALTVIERGGREEALRQGVRLQHLFSADDFLKVD